MRYLPPLLVALAATAPAFAEDRAVVISNSDYRNAPELADADVSPAAEALEEAGFATAAGTDLGIDDIRETLATLLKPDDDPGARIVLLNGHFLNDGRDSWYMGTDANEPDLIGVPSQGASVATILSLMKDAAPGAVLLIGTEDEAMEHGSGLEPGLGTLTAPEGVTVISGPAAQMSAAALALLKPGATVGDVTGADEALVLAEGGDPELSLISRPADEGAGDQTAADRDEWAKAAGTDTAEAYQSYLDRFPKGQYADAAQTRLDALGQVKSDRDVWADAAAANTVAAYDDYLSRFPDGEFSEAASRRRTELLLAENATREPAAPAAPAPAPAPAPARQPEIQQPRPADPAPRVSSAERGETRLNLSRADRMSLQRRLNNLGYATGGTDGVFGQRSRSAIRGWQQRNGLDVTGYLTAEQIRILRQQTPSVTAGASNGADDRAYWRQTGEVGGVRNLRAYLDRYPNGIYANNARQRLDAHAARTSGNGGSADAREDRAWSRARNANTVQAYTDYLQSWPRGEHAREADERRSRLIRQGQVGGGDLNVETILREFLK